MENFEYLPTVLKAAALEKHGSIAAFARACGYDGPQPGLSVHGYLTGERTPGLLNAALFADRAGIGLDDLIKKI